MAPIQSISEKVGKWMPFKIFLLFYPNNWNDLKWIWVHKSHPQNNQVQTLKSKVSFICQKFRRSSSHGDLQNATGWTPLDACKLAWKGWFSDFKFIWILVLIWLNQNARIKREIKKKSRENDQARSATRLMRNTN